MCARTSHGLTQKKKWSTKITSTMFGTTTPATTRRKYSYNKHKGDLPRKIKYYLGDKILHPPRENTYIMHQHKGDLPIKITTYYLGDKILHPPRENNTQDAQA